MDKSAKRPPFRLNPHAAPFERLARPDPVEILRKEEEAQRLLDKENSRPNPKQYRNATPDSLKKHRTPVDCRAMDLLTPVSVETHSAKTPYSAKTKSPNATPLPYPQWSPATQKKMASPETRRQGMSLSSPSFDDGSPKSELDLSTHSMMNFSYSSTSPMSPATFGARKGSWSARRAASARDSVGGWKAALQNAYKQSLTQSVLIPAAVLAKFGISEPLSSPVDTMKHETPPSRFGAHEFDAAQESAIMKGANPKFVTDFFNVARTLLEEFGPGNLQAALIQLSEMIKQGQELEELEEEVGTMPW